MMPCTSSLAFAAMIRSSTSPSSSMSGFSAAAGSAAASLLPSGLGVWPSMGSSCAASSQVRQISNSMPTASHAFFVHSA
jgi:hypothetical protein